MAARYQWDDFVLDLDSYRLERAGVALSLEPKAFNLLVLMIQRPGHLFTKQEIFDALWPDTAVTDHALTRVVAQLRRVLGDEAREARYLETVPTRGYRWIKEPLDPPKRLQETSGAEADHSNGAVAAKADHSVLPGLSAAFAIGLVAFSFLIWAQRNQTTAASIENPARAHDPKWPVQITTHAGLDMHPAMSPQGDAIAFVSDRSGSFEIYVRGLNGASGELPLTSDGAQNMQPAWSPDGRFIAYHANKNGGIWVIPSRGGTPRQVSSIGARPAWSPDGTRIAFQSDEFGDIAPSGYSAQAGSTIWIADRDGRSVRAISKSTTPIGGHASPAWSHDGRFIVFSVFDSGSQNGIWIVSADSGETWPIDITTNLYDPVFAQDDSAVYAAGADALIVRLPVDLTGKRSGPREIIPVTGVPGVRGLSLSPDGRRLAFSGMALDSQIWSLALAPNGDAADPKPLTIDTSRRNSTPVISPDGRKIAYMSIRRGELANVWMMNIDGSAPMQLTPDETADQKPAWFPDGTRVAYLSRRGDTGAVLSVDVTTRRVERVFDFAAAARYPELKGWLAAFEISPSMTQFAFSMVTSASGGRGLFVSPTTAFEPRVVAAPPIAARYPSWSRDETRLAVELIEAGSSHAGVIDLATGLLRQLTMARGHTWPRSWSPDGHSVAVAAMRDGRWSVRSIDVTTGKEVALTTPYPPGVYVRYPEWSPKGDRVLFERGVTRGNIWTIAIE